MDKRYFSIYKLIPRKSDPNDTTGSKRAMKLLRLEIPMSLKPEVFCKKEVKL